MPYRIPIELGEIYHVFNRGVEKRRIFVSKQDYSRFLLALYYFNDKNSSDIWSSLKSWSPKNLKLGRPDLPRLDERKQLVEILAACLMPNHYHLITREIVEGGLVLFMKKIGGYSLYFNKQHDRVGPLFQSRYKAVHVKDDIQLANVFAYVHTNPVELWESGWKDLRVKDERAAIRRLEEYRLSSYLDYIGTENLSDTIEKDFFLSLFGGESGCRQIVEDWIKFKAQNTRLSPEFLDVMF